MSQVLKMASVISKLQTTLDVYEGMFAEKENAALVFCDFQEIAVSLKASLTTHLIIGCAALFSDPDKTCGNENMSLKNLVAKYESSFSTDTNRIKDEIFDLVQVMNLKTFRNKHVGHFGLEECLGYKSVKADITVDKVRLLLKKAQSFINCVISDASLMPAGHQLALYTEIPRFRSTEVFLKRVSGNA